MTEVIFSPLAEGDLAEIVDFIAQDDPSATGRVLAKIRSANDDARGKTRTRAPT